ncbi:DNA helicase ino80 [Fusarium sporotrichioides]|uniref:Chromatin-remodeling ATPase INO80 n=1 Tax=Fusarium sporotrichioides TaxID=5514 RepID=A0A395S083_FUSSP|nr:DNA helicase ino80 [Fusarium sporotrichioides]
MDQNGYNSSVLQRPPRRGDDGGEEDRDSRPHHHHRHHHHHHHHRRDGDLPAGPVAGEAATASSNAGGANAHQHSTFSLRSPKSEYRPPPFSSPNGHNHSHQNTSTPSANHSLQSPPRPALSNPYMSSSTSAPGGPVAPPLPPPVGINSSSSPGSSAVGLHQHHHQSGAPAHPHRAAPPPVSPLHPPVAYYPPGTNTDIYIPPPEPKPASRGFYDPTTDTTKERRISDAATPGASWHNANANAPPAGTPKTRDPYSYSQTADQHTPSYYNGSYTSPRGPSYNRPRSPPSHSHQNPPAGSLSPPGQQPLLASPSVRHGATANMNSTTNGASAMPPFKSDLAAPSPPKPAPSSTTSRANPMSFDSILSSSEPASKPKEPSPIVAREPEIKQEREPRRDREPKRDSREPKQTKRSLEPEPDHDTEVEKDVETEPEPIPSREKEKEPAAKKRGARKSTKGRASDIRDAATPKNGRRPSVKKESPTPRLPAKRQANGQPKPKTWSAEMEKKIQNAETQIENRVANLDADEFDEQQYKERAQKRRRVMSELDVEHGLSRRDAFATSASKKLVLHAELGKRRYDDVFYDEALHEVREQEVYAEKERKKDMQRKRRREKSMAVTMEQKEAALARAEAAEDETERQKHLRDAERASKKAQQTKLILQKGIKGPARNLEINLEGGTMSSFQASDVESGEAGTPSGKRKGKGRSGPRLKKSKEQKQAEKDSAEAAQAALDAGEELPTKEENRVRIKIKKTKKDVAVDSEKDKDEAEKTEEEVVEKKTKKSKDKDKDKEKVDDIPDNEKRFMSKGYNQIYDQIWRDMARKDVNKTFKLAVDSYATKASNLKKTAILASKEAKRWQLRTNKGTKDLQARAKRVMRDMMGFWKRNEREERDLRKAAEKQEIENARKEEADREAARQKRKLNFLISQTELYSHFIGKKIKTDEVERSTDNPDVAKDAHHVDQKMLDIDEPTGPVTGKVTNFENLDFEEGSDEALRAAAMANAQNAIAEAQKKARDFNNQGLDMDDEGEMNFQNPTGLGDVEIEQPKLINAQLKEYQLKGLNWLVNLYEQGINGILADEMGLGKTVQSISVMAYLAEKHDIWGPFLVVAPASTLHNWQQEIAKFVPEFKILPYWGGASDRKVLRKFWDRKHTTYRKDAPFHVCVTSYQLVVSDVAYFQKMRWQYMILDEAQAIKSSQSSRWKALLNFHCRNRLLLTGTPIQNNMQELWALLHFIMPSLFDSHDEFSEWFSKDIESHAQSNTKLNEDQLKRLHMILKPFMLRRVKKHVQKELGDKIELDIFCDLTYRQRAYYSNLRNQINIMDLVEKATMGDEQDSGTLMNLVMQFRKVCNHPDLFERAEVNSPFACAYFAETASFVREGNDVAVGYSSRNLIEYELPRLVWRDGGRVHKAGPDSQVAGWKNRTLNHLMNIWSPDNIRDSSDGSKAFSWLRFADTSPNEAYQATHQSLIVRAAKELQKRDRLGYMNVAYSDTEDAKFTPAHALFQIRPRQNRKPLAEITNEGILSRLMNVAQGDYDESGLGRLESAGRPRASAPPIQVSCRSWASEFERSEVLFNAPIRKILYGPTVFEEKALIAKKLPVELWPTRQMLPKPDHEKKGFTNISVPSMQRFVTDSGKLAKLDELLFKLKSEGHRVLLYFQMTRMIDMMEEYLTYRNYKYCRLDGSTKLEDRRDTVHDFQTRPEIFIFLLSTRAGGLGINLTTADTVIFYDSDWNPTIDSQAMDRAHRLGQTKQVTVYRLITRGTIEERIRKRAMQKEEVQRVVIQGGGASVDFSGRRAPENRNRDIAMWLADDEQAEMIERREKELLESGELEKQQKKKGGKRRKAENSASLDEMYHEGEGNFDDGSKGVSGTATPATAATPADSDSKGKKGRKGTKRAKTAKQRLAIADGMME